MRGRDHPHVDANGLFAPEALELVVLKHLQQLGLELVVHIADFIEKDGALVGHLEHARLALESAGKRAALVAEQLALHKFGGQRGAIELEEGLAGARRAGVQLARQHLFARARLALNHHRGLGPTHLPQHAVDGVHARAAALENLHFQPEVLGRRRRGGGVRAPAERFANRAAEILMRHRLGNVIGGALLHGLHHAERRGYAGDDDHRQHGVRTANLLQRFHAVFPGHDEVQQDGGNFGLALLESPHHLLAVLRQFHPVSLTLECHRKVIANFRIVFPENDRA